MADYKLNMTGAQIDERLQITKMPNPNALTFTGGVSVSYDGSEEKTIEIPEAVTDEQIENSVKKYMEENPIEASDAEKILRDKCLVAYNGTDYNQYPVELENYSWNHFSGTKRLAPLVENAKLFTSDGSTAHEANGVGFNRNWFLLQWVQNTVGTTVDMEDAAGSCEIQGKLMYWRYALDYPLTGESKTFTISKKGDAIKRTITGDTIAAGGGVGICNVANKDATTIYSIATYYYNGKHIPTTKEITIDSTDYTTNYDNKLSLGDATMWTIAKNGATCDWDDDVLGTEYGGHVNCQIYCDYGSGGYNYHMAVVRPNKGLSIITSTDCTNWTWIADVDIPGENTAYIETALTYFGNRWYVAVRCKDGRLWISKLMSDYSVNWNFYIPDCGSKPQFLRWNKSLILACAPQSRCSCRLYRFESNDASLSESTYPDRIEAVGDITYNACNYPFFVGIDGYPGYQRGVGVATFLCLGTNNFTANKLGCSYFVDQPFKYLKYPNEAVNDLFSEAFSGSWNDLTDRPFYKQGEQVVPIPDEYMPKDYINRLIDARLDASLGEVAELIGGDAQ